MATLGQVRRGAVASAALWGLLGSAAGQAQEAQDGGFLATFSISPQLVYSDDGGNEDGLIARTGLGLAIRDITTSRQFFVEATGRLEEGLSSDADTPSGIDEPRFELGYSFGTRETEIDLTASYAERDVDDTFVDPETSFLILDEGTRRDLSLGLAVAFGLESPFGGTFTLSRFDTRVDGTTDDRLQDSTTNRAGLSLRFQLDPRIALTTAGSVVDLDGDDRDRRSERVSTGLEFAVTPTLNADTSVGYERVTVDEDGERDVDDGVTFGIGLSKAQPRGELTGRLTSDVTENGRRTQLNFGQNIDFPTATLAYGLGIVYENDDFAPLFSLSYAQELARSELNVSLRQYYLTDIEGDETISTTLSASVTRELTPVDFVTGAISLQDTAVQSGDADDARRTAFDVTYSRVLTQDWSLVSGAGYSKNDRDVAEDDTDSEVFVGLQRTFSWRR